MSATPTPSTPFARVVLFVSRLISRFAPPLHSIHWKVFILFMVVLALPLGFVGYKIRGSIETSYMLRNLAVPIALAVVIAVGLAFLLSGYITRTVAGMASKAERIASGEAGVSLETWSKSELGTLARSVEKMRRKLEGKAYVEEMATNLSHELKTPLASIRGAAEVLEDGAIDDPAARAKFLRNIQTEVQRLDRLVDDLLKLSRIETHPGDLATGPIDITPVVSDIVTLYRTRAENLGLRFSADLPLGPVAIKISEAQLKQMLVNLLDNALQFTPSGRAISLVVANGEFRIKDEGPGIESDLLPKIFDRFFTTQNPRTGNRGTGLGLAIVKSIVESNHGTILARSKPGEGAEFVVRFPVV